MSEFTNLYTNFSSAGDWDKADEEQSNTVALTTNLNDTKDQVAKLSKSPKAPAATGTARIGIEAWKFNNVKNSKTTDSVKHMWWKEHGRNYTEGVG